MFKVSAEVQERLAAFLGTRASGTLFSGVPFSGAPAGWPDGSPVHLLDGVWVDTPGRSEVVPWGVDGGKRFADAFSRHDALLLGARGYADRTLFGRLLAGRDLLARAHPVHGRLDITVLADRRVWRSLAYLAEGMQIVRPDGTPPEVRTFGPPQRRRQPAKLSAEDRLIAGYFQRTYRGRGRMIQEVPVTDARLDAIYVPDAGVDELVFWPDSASTSLAAVVASRDVEVIEAKSSISLDVIGQVIAGAILLAHEVPDHRLIRQTILVGPASDDALEWFCAKRGVRVVKGMGE